MPLDEDIKGGHGEGEAGVEVLPDAVHDFLEMAHDGEHGEHRLDELHKGALPAPICRRPPSPRGFLALSSSLTKPPDTVGECTSKF